MGSRGVIEFPFLSVWNYYSEWMAIKVNVTLVKVIVTLGHYQFMVIVIFAHNLYSVIVTFDNQVTYAKHHYLGPI